MHPGAVAVIVWKQKGLPLRWLNYVPDRLCDTENGQRFQAFTPDSIKWLLSFLVEQTFVTFTGRLYHQLLGIPMGISPAVFIANFYLHTYEYDFYRQLLPLQAAGVRSPLHVAALRHLMVAGIAPPGGSADVSALVLDSFLYTTRYIDDMYSLANPILQHLTYVNQTWFGVHGLYPPTLNLAVAHQGAEVFYIDMRVVMSYKYQGLGGGRFQGIADFETYLYAKHVHGPFRFLKLIRFPHITSSLSWTAKYNIITTEFHRLTRRVTNHADLWDHLGRIGCDMVCRGYQVVRIMRTVRRLFYRHGVVLGFRGQGILYARLVAQRLVAHLGLRRLHAAFTTALRAAGFL